MTMNARDDRWEDDEEKRRQLERLAKLCREIEAYEEAKRARGPNANWASYQLCDWGDVIYGTKEQLQALGLGIGRAYPGEVGGPVRSLSVIDPRGLKARIEAWVDSDQYVASIPFPWLPERPGFHREVGEVFPGVLLRETRFSDDFTGSPEALVAAGLISAGQFPGLPGMRKTVVTVYADGTLPTGSPHRKDPRARQPGSREVTRFKGQGQFCVSIRIPESESEERSRAFRTAENDWLLDVRRFERPPRLAPMPAETLANMAAAAQRAARDIQFQGMLTRLLAITTRP